MNPHKLTKTALGLDHELVDPKQLFNAVSWCRLFYTYFVRPKNHVDKVYSLGHQLPFFRRRWYHRLWLVLRPKRNQFRSEAVIPFVEVARSWWWRADFISQGQTQSGIAILVIVILMRPVSSKRITAMAMAESLCRAFAMIVCSKARLNRLFDWRTEACDKDVALLVTNFSQAKHLKTHFGNWYCQCVFEVIKVPYLKTVEAVIINCHWRPF